MSSYNPSDTFYNSAMYQNSSSSYPGELNHGSSSNQLPHLIHYYPESHWPPTNVHGNDATMTSTALNDMNVQITDLTYHQPMRTVNCLNRVQTKTSMGNIQHYPPPLDQLILNQLPSIHVGVAEDKKPPAVKYDQQFHNPAKSLDSPQIQNGYAQESTVNNDGTAHYFNFSTSSNQTSQLLTYRQQGYWPSTNLHANNTMMTSTDLEDLDIQITDQTHHRPLATISVTSPAVPDDKQFHNPAESLDPPQIRDGYAQESTVNNDGTTHYVNFASSSNQASQLITYLEQGYWPSTNLHGHDARMTSTILEDMNMQLTEAMLNQPLDSVNRVQAGTAMGNNQNCPLLDNFMATNSEASTEESQLVNDFDDAIPISFDAAFEAANIIFEPLEYNSAYVSEGTNIEGQILNNNEPSEQFPTILPREPAIHDEKPTQQDIQPLSTKGGRPRRNMNTLQASVNNRVVLPPAPTINEEVPTPPKRKRGRPRKNENTSQSSTIETLTITPPIQTSQNDVTKDRKAKLKLLSPDFSFNEQSSPGCSGNSIYAKSDTKVPEDKENAEYVPEEDLTEEELSEEELSEKVTSLENTEEERRKKNNLASKDSRKKLKEKLAQQKQLKERLSKDNMKLKEVNKRLEEALEILQKSQNLRNCKEGF
ncbi:uncharacterized protein LOC124364307 [Homalodisca vitripennis]|uniref:uncharacterized protein LOC124364307 n=1 Tax=Homalodisca vitripennis TaxID=197043 RepID=UPI001EEA45E0|nr:uncharacterized protein LOC124364307 [Homalodisca vitripennis]